MQMSDWQDRTPLTTLHEISRLRAITRCLCPRCRRGRIFFSHFKMHSTCPVCDLKFQREAGYFLGAMYVQYFLIAPLLGLLIFVLSFILPDDWPAYQVVLPAIVLYLPFLPAVFRYSRIIWIHLDRALDPDEN